MESNLPLQRASDCILMNCYKENNYPVRTLDRAKKFQEAGQYISIQLKIRMGVNLSCSGG